MRRLLSILMLSVLLLPLFPAEVEETETMWENMTFFSGIVSTSYLSDFAYSMFPVSFGGEYGIKGIELLENRTTRLVATLDAGMTQRTLRQYPETGKLIKDPGSDEKYSVVFSDSSIGLRQGLIDNPRKGKADFLTMNIRLGMRWEQAFASFSDIQDGEYSGVFENTEYFPSGQAEYAGTPELSYGLHSLSTYFYLSFSFRNEDNDYLAPGGYRFDVDFMMAPWWLFNDAVLTDAEIDFYRVRYSASYSYTIMQAKWDNGFNIYSLVFDFSLSSQFLFGEAVPRFAYVQKFRGKEIPPRTFITDVSARLTLNGPEVLTYGTYPELNLMVENALSSGDLVNSSDTREMKLYGSVGLRATVHVMNMFEAYISLYYDYLEMEGYDNGFSYSVGVRFTYSF